MVRVGLGCIVLGWIGGLCAKRACQAHKKARRPMKMGDGHFIGVTCESRIEVTLVEFGCDSVLF